MSLCRDNELLYFLFYPHRFHYRGTLFFFFVSASRQTRVPEDEQAEMTEITKADTDSTPFSILYITSSEDKIIKSSRKTKVLSQEKQIIKS